MRRIRHLKSSDVIVPIRQPGAGVVTASGESAIKLERVWSQHSSSEVEVELHAFFDGDSLNGVKAFSFLKLDGKKLSSSSGQFTLYIVDQTDFSETEIVSVAATETLGIHSVAIPAVDFLPNELSGSEVYAIEFTCVRVRRRFKKKIYLNHLGVFENVIMLRRAVEQLFILKADD